MKYLMDLRSAFACVLRVLVRSSHSDTFLWFVGRVGFGFSLVARAGIWQLARCILPPVEDYQQGQGEEVGGRLHDNC